MTSTFKQATVILATALILTGCGGETATNQSQFPAPPPGAGGPVPNQNFFVNLGPFGNTQRADLVFSSVYSGNTLVSLENKNRHESRGRKAALPRIQGPLYDLPPEVQERNRERIARLLEHPERVRPRGEVRSRFQELAAGDTVDLNVIDNVVTCQKILAEDQTVHCTILAEVVDGNPVVTEAEALSIAEAFDTNNPFRPGSGIYDQVRAAFGSEWNVNPTGGRDGDLKINLVMLSANTIGGPLGFFNAVDEFSKLDFPDSNEGELLYISADAPLSLSLDPSFDILAIVAHEFQHLIEFNAKVGQQGSFAGPGDDGATINEGKSVLAEDLCGFSLTARGGGSNPRFQAVFSYLQTAYLTNLFEDDDYATKYGGGYLLMRYFREQFGDAALLTAASNSDTGFANLAAVAGLSEQELFRRFCIALAANDMQGSIAPEFRFPSGFTTTSTFTIRGLGEVTLPGLAVEGTLNPPTTPVDLEVLPFSPTLYRVEGGSGKNLVITGTFTGKATMNTILQSAPKVVTEIRSDELTR